MKTKFIVILIILTLGFIWGNSVIPPDLSNAVSDQVTTTVGGKILHDDAQETSTDTWLTSGHIRKAAHLTEFAVLGTGLMILTVLKHKTIRYRWPNLALFGLVVAVIDETIQLFSGRNSAVGDIWIDSTGFAFGVCATAAITRLIARRKQTRLQGVDKT